MLQIVYAPVAQMEERDASNVEVAGPSPARSSTILVSQVVNLRALINGLTPQPKFGVPTLVGAPQVTAA